MAGYTRTERLGFLVDAVALVVAIDFLGDLVDSRLSRPVPLSLP
jgi:hypothetical protein